VPPGGLCAPRPPGAPRPTPPHSLPQPLAHPIYEKGKAQVCLFVKDHKGEGHEEAKRRHAQMANTGIHKVIGISQLRKKYESFESKRNLCNSYDIFLADERIVPSLPRLIGKKFFKSKKQPVPVNVAGSNWGAKVDKALAGTFMVNPQGSCFSFKVAVSNQTRAQIAENVTVALKAACDLVPKKFDNVSAVYLKTAESAALPVYQALPQPLQKI